MICRLSRSSCISTIWESEGSWWRGALFERGACLILWPRVWALIRGRALTRACALIWGNAICTIWEKRAEEIFWATSLMIPSLKADKVQTCSKEFSLASLPFRRMSSKIAFFTSWKNERKTPFSGKICSFVSCSRHSGSSWFVWKFVLNCITICALPARIGIFLNPQLFLSQFKNFHVQTYPDSNRICPSIRIQHVSGLTLVPRTPLGMILPSEHASY